MTRCRADVALAEQGLFESRERAKAAILAGEVRIDGRPLTKAGEQVPLDAHFEIAAVARYVSRGGYKLAGALDEFGIDVEGRRVADIGASTGGFTDCLLQRGARSVCAVDVGYGQLAWKLREDHRVQVFERTNIRHANPADLGAPFELVVADLSFISIRAVMAKLVELLSETGEMCLLVKPQFEAGKGSVGKKGVVKSAETHQRVLEAVIGVVSGEGLVVRGLTWSPIKGPEGNIEFWIHATRVGEDVELDPQLLVADAHRVLGE